VKHAQKIRSITFALKVRFRAKKMSRLNWNITINGIFFHFIFIFQYWKLLGGCAGGVLRVLLPVSNTRI